MAVGTSTAVRWIKAVPFHWLAVTSMLVAASDYIRAVLATGGERTLVFSTYWAAGKALRTGADPFSWLPETYSGYIGDTLFGDVNLNPPIFLPIAQGLAQFPLTQAAIGWCLLSVVLLIGTVLAYGRAVGAERVRVAWALLLPAFANSLFLGQNYLLLYLPAFVLGWAVLTGRMTVAAAAAGWIVAFKPNLGMILPVLALAGHWRFAIRSGLVAGGLTLLPAILYGPNIYWQWLAAVRGDFHWMLPATVSIASAFKRLGMEGAGWAVVAVLAAGVLWHARSRRPALPEALATGFLLGMLCSPLAWYHYLIVIVPFLMIWPWRADQVGGPLLVGAGLMLVSPDWIGRLAQLSGGPGVAAQAFHTLVALILLLGVLVRAGMKPATDPEHCHGRVSETGHGKGAQDQGPEGG